MLWKNKVDFWDKFTKLCNSLNAIRKLLKSTVSFQLKIYCSNIKKSVLMIKKLSFQINNLIYLFIETVLKPLIMAIFDNAEFIRANTTNKIFRDNYQKEILFRTVGELSLVTSSLVRRIRQLWLHLNT